jgi:hypothetical protein
MDYRFTRYMLPIQVRALDGGGGGTHHANGGSGATSPGLLYAINDRGNRVLPSIYTSLDNFWLRANGHYIHPRDMNTQHIRHVLNLLKESHSNLIGRINSRLGKMHDHMRGARNVQDALSSIAQSIESTDVAAIYPIWNVLSAELQRRQRGSRMQAWHGLDHDIPF